MCKMCGVLYELNRLIEAHYKSRLRDESSILFVESDCDGIVKKPIPVT